MSAVPKTRFISFEEYLALEVHADHKSEYYKGEIFAMAGATHNHIKISSCILIALGVRLKGKPCQPLNNDTKVLVQTTGLTTYPDVTILCGPGDFVDEKKTVLLNPTVLIEVASESTAKYDRTVKLRHYKQIPSVKEIVFVAQDEPFVEKFARDAAGAWPHSEVIGLESSLTFDSIQIAVPLSEIYERVTFPPAEPADEHRPPLTG